MGDSYLTIKESVTCVYKEKGSKFLAFAYPVESENEAVDLINNLKKEYHDAKHHCYAYSLGDNLKQYRTHDAGEPRHSAGDQILNQIRSTKVSDVLVIVIRYFGGTKLGLKRLINAYRTASMEALGNAELVEKISANVVSIRFRFSGLDEVMRLISINDIHLIDQRYDNECFIKVKTPNSELDKITGLFNALPHVYEVKILSGRS